MSTLLQLSDTHFGAEVASVMEALRRLVAQQQVQHALLAGDITMRATRLQFAAARVYMDSLPLCSYMVLPGNHDIALWRPWERLFWPYHRYQDFFPTAFDRDGVIHWDLGAIQLIGVRTTRRYRHIQGEVSGAQIRNVCSRLQALPPDTLKLVAVHQPVLVIESGERKNLLRGAVQANAAWRAAGAAGVLGGHIHEPYVELVPASRNNDAPLWAIQSGTAISHRVRANYPNSVNLIRPCSAARPPAGPWHNPLGLQAPSWQVERWDFDAHQQSFTCVSTTWLR